MIVAFCGIDGSGKSALVNLLAERQLIPNCRAFRKVRGHNVTRIIQSHHMESPSYLSGPMARLLCQAYAIDFVDYYRNVQPQLIEAIGIMDRWKPCLEAWSSLLPARDRRSVQTLYSGLPDADIVFFLDTDPIIAHSRVRQRRTKGTDENLGVLQQLRSAYISVFESYRGRVVLLEQSDLTTMAERAASYVRQLIL